ncbi:MAG TPA: carbohydrate-binding family 6 protein, partial [Opitutaceae bacterium]|nr:carbohydrate-binding family 6 protein [Opitutaceae bacterium]
ADRGISVYIFTWNIFTYGAEGKYGITSDMSNRTTVAYFRASVRELVKTYPLLAGIGITAGEAMEANNPNFTKEQWLWATYGEGVRDALKDTPARGVRLIHRFH